MPHGFTIQERGLKDNNDSILTIYFFYDFNDIPNFESKLK